VLREQVSEGSFEVELVTPDYFPLVDGLLRESGNLAGLSEDQGTGFLFEEQHFALKQEVDSLVSETLPCLRIAPGNEIGLLKLLHDHSLRYIDRLLLERDDSRRCLEFVEDGEDEV